MQTESSNFMDLFIDTRAAGKAEGRAEGKAEAVLAFLNARNIEVPERVRQEVLAATDPELLDTWVKRAATAATADEVIAER
ncbi:hypothetical protein [Actinomadura flavalba]|uniref:hypothetical protein n=1 Tax=Actinomadura flavalba TaxID=1120938 RepID=UPI00035D07C6|nr:hypothetical protein [Actinomadura flavalba]